MAKRWTLLRREVVEESFGLEGTEVEVDAAGDSSVANVHGAPGDLKEHLQLLTRGGGFGHGDLAGIFEFARLSFFYEGGRGR
jgi:hypothetical protein